jgi:hypoxanthine phosphoribosyltransferase
MTNESHSNSVRFAHPSEEEFSRILDFYAIDWEYEPRSFPLKRDERGNILEAFSPDFYLPKYDLYIELTTLRQQLATKKHRKIRELQELYPDIRIKLVNRRAFGELLVKYGLQEERGELVGQEALKRGNGDE